MASCCGSAHWSAAAYWYDFEPINRSSYEALASQQKQLEDLHYKVRHVIDRVKSIQPSNIAKQSEEMPPPHYWFRGGEVDASVCFFDGNVSNSTESSIHSGVIIGVVKEIDGVIDQYREKYPDLTVILTGGDANFLSNQLKNSIFAHSNFLLEGLNFILDYNSKI